MMKCTHCYGVVVVVVVALVVLGLVWLAKPQEPKITLSAAFPTFGSKNQSFV